MRNVLLLLAALFWLATPGLPQAPAASPMPDTMPVDLPEDPGTVVPS